MTYFMLSEKTSNQPSITTRDFRKSDQNITRTAEC